MSKFSFVHGSNVNFLETHYQEYQRDPESVDPSWQAFFQGYEIALESGGSGNKSFSDDDAHNHAKIEALINAYRRIGHLCAHLNPLDNKPELIEELIPEHSGLVKVNTNTKFRPSNFGKQDMTFTDIVSHLNQTYCNFIGADFRETNNIEAIEWLQKEMEACQNQPVVDQKEKLFVYQCLARAEGFEQFLQKRYLGQKRFSIEGLESLIPLMKTLIETSGELEIEELCMGMAHRGRLNVLANIMEKPLPQILSEFEGAEANPFDIDGDVKYHLGYGNVTTTLRNKKIKLYLSPNPSHLEAVNPVVEGFSRARQEEEGVEGYHKILPVLLHGDASFVGQGIVAETLNLSKLSSYHTGGTIHIITNNQIGFTTNPFDSRSCTYSSDISKVIRAPVLHVNADQPEAVIWASKLAVMFRHKFNEDIVIDLIGYRRHGHNETDEPRFTQPLMYDVIGKHKSVYAQYGARLVAENVLSESEKDAYMKTFHDEMEEAFQVVRSGKWKSSSHNVPLVYKDIFAYKKAEIEDIFEPVDTKISLKQIKSAAEKYFAHPKDFNVNSKLKRILNNRQEMLEGKGSVDWGFAELLSFASLAEEGVKVRLSGQDCGRGTFSSRHGVLYDAKTGQSFAPLSEAYPEAPVDIINSPLSEQGCLGFEFGYSIARPKALVLWEAQFGDFANGAQIIIDQFISASEAKWKQTSSLTMMLPHGFEGLGPEHSSARPERFLQNCGNLNIQVCNVTRPAQLFHLLRRQVLRNFRKPLIIMTPKSLLRHPEVKSELLEFTDQGFMEVLDDHFISQPEKVDKLLLCTGKIYYELMAVRHEHKEDDIKNTPIVRIEQMYPFPSDQIKSVLKDRYPALKEVIWVQEEPQNMGAWTFIQPRLLDLFAGKIRLCYLGRKYSGTTAEGSGKAHQAEQRRILDEAFSKVCAWDPNKKVAN